MNPGLEILLEGFKARLDLFGEELQVLSSGAKFIGIIEPAPPIDPDFPLGSDLREKSLLHVLTEDDPGINKYGDLISPTAPAEDSTSEEPATSEPDGDESPDVWEVIRRENNPGGGGVRWTRTYAQVPDTYDDFENYVYSFIGFAAGGDANSLNAPGRNRESFAVPSRLRYEFFITDPSGRIANPPDGRVYRSPGHIPLLQPLSYWLVDQQFPVRNPTPWTVELIEDSPPYTQPTSPRLTSYRTWINHALDVGFDGDTIDGFDPEGDRFGPPGTQPWKSLINPSQFPVEQSALKRWQGSIWVRITRTILAR